MSETEEILQRCEPSIGAMLARRVELSGDRVAFLTPKDQRRKTEWVPLTWRETQYRAHTAAAGLLSLGLQPGQRVAIVSNTRLEWIIADLAVGCAAGATTAIYPNTTTHDMLHILSDSQSRFLIAEDREQLAKVQALDVELYDQVERIIILDDDRSPQDRADPRVITWDDLAERGKAYLAETPSAVTDTLAAISHDDLATLIYTSGTTGRPKGVELSHLCWVYQGHAVDYLDVLSEEDLQYLWLPLSHVFGKDLIGIQIAIGFSSAVDGRIDRIVQGLGEIRPTFMCGAPRIFEKVRSTVVMSTQSSPVKRRIARWAFSVGYKTIDYRLQGRELPAALRIRYRLANKLVFSKLQERLGGNLRFLISGSAKLNAQVQRWFYAAGITIVEGYGSTETTAVAFVNNPKTPRFGTVGQVCPGVDVRIADDGEVLLRGPIITHGYYNLPEVTSEVLQDGWFYTGDIGELDDQGYLTITDRKKDLIKTSGGKYVAPMKVEGALIANIPMASQAVVVGEGRKYCVALLTMDEVNLLTWAKQNGFGDLSYAEVTQLPQLHTAVQGYVTKANSHLERWETVKEFTILDHQFSTQDGGTTPNMKIRRQFIDRKYASTIDAMYPTD